MINVVMTVTVGGRMCHLHSQAMCGHEAREMAQVLTLELRSSYSKTLKLVRNGYSREIQDSRSTVKSNPRPFFFFFIRTGVSGYRRVFTRLASSERLRIKGCRVGWFHTDHLELGSEQETVLDPRQRRLFPGSCH